MTSEPELEELRRREELARRMGGEERVGRQHASGRLTVRERIKRLYDDGTFHGVEEIIDPRDTRALLCDWAERAHELVTQDVAAGPKARGLRP